MSLHLTILGSSGALPAYGRFPSCQLVNLDNRQFLIDCGEGAQMQLMKVNASPQKISHIFISHLHGDHYLGLAGLLFSMHLNRRESDLHIYSFRGLDEMILSHLKHSRTTLNYRLIFHPLRPQVQEILLEDDLLTVESLPLLHKIDCSGFLLREKPKPKRIDKSRLQPGMLLQHIALLKTGQDVVTTEGQVLYRNEDYTLPPRPSISYAYCSDTAFHPDLIANIKDVDLLYHEATFMEAEKDKATETRHSTARQAAELALRAQARRLLLGHFSARYRDLEGLLTEAKTVFPNTRLAEECVTIKLEEWI